MRGLLKEYDQAEADFHGTKRSSRSLDVEGSVMKRVETSMVCPQIPLSVACAYDRADSGSEESPDEDFTHAHQPHNANAEAGPSEPRTKFMFAWTSAAQL